MKYDFDTAPDHRHNGSYRWGMADMPPDVIGMGTADLDYYCAPCIRKALLPIAEENCYNYRQHSEDYYRSAVGWYKRKYGLDVRREWLSNVPSTIGAIRIALRTYAGPGDRVLVHAPVFGPVATAIEGADLVRVDSPMIPVDGHYEIDFEDFEAKVRAFRPSVFLMVNPHNPTGKVFTEAELNRLVDICYANGVKIISDEVHSLIVHDGHKHTPVLAVSEKAREISVQVVSFSKGYNLMSLPHAIVTVADPELRAAWERQINAHSFGYAVNSFAIAAVTSVMKGEADEWMDQLRAYLKQNIDETVDYIYKHGIPLKPYYPEAGFLLWIDCREAGIGDEHLDRYFMDRCRISLDDGEKDFGFWGKGFIRINIAVTNRTLKEALGRLERAF